VRILSFSSQTILGVFVVNILFRVILNTDYMYEIVKSILNVAISFYVITGTTVSIIIKLRLRVSQNVRQNSAHTNATSLLLSAIIYVIVTIIPLRIFFFVYSDRLLSAEYIDNIQAVFVYLYFLNFVLNFYIYFAFNVHFRRDTLKLLGFKQSNERPVDAQVVT